MWSCGDSGGTGPPVDEVRPISRDLVWVSGTVIRPISWYGLDTQAHCRMRHVYVMLCHILVTGDHQLHRRGDHLPYHDVELEGGVCHVMSDDEGAERHYSSRYDRPAVHADPRGGAHRPPNRYLGPGHTEVSMGWPVGIVGAGSNLLVS